MAADPHGKTGYKVAVSLLRALDPRRHFCFVCDRRTVLEHLHSDATIAALLREEWRR